MSEDSNREVVQAVQNHQTKKWFVYVDYYPERDPFLIKADGSFLVLEQDDERFSGPSEVELSASNFSEAQLLTLKRINDEADKLWESRPHMNQGLNSYSATRLKFKKSVISRLGMDEHFKIITPYGTYQMTRREFETNYPNIATGYSYNKIGEYHFPGQPPAHAERFKLK